MQIFFVFYYKDREHKLPVDQNLMMALVAPRGLMLSSALSEGAGNPWAIEQAYFSAEKVLLFVSMYKSILALFIFSELKKRFDHRNGCHR